MNYDMLTKAEELAITLFSGKVDKDGEPYITHCRQVSSGSRKVAFAMGLSETEALTVAVVGMLHDVLEDTDITFNTLAIEFDPDVAMLVDNVSKRAKGIETNDEYYARVMSHKLSTIVKFADTNHNGQLNRLSAPSLKMVKKCAEYARLNCMLAKHLGLV